MMKLTAHIKKAADGWMELDVDELPGLVAGARNVEDIPSAVRAAAAAFTGRAVQDFDVEVMF